MSTSFLHTAGAALLTLLLAANLSTGQESPAPAAEDTEPVAAESVIEETEAAAPEIPLGENCSVTQDVEELVLENRAFDYKMLLDALPQLKELKKLVLEETRLPFDEIRALRDAAGDTEVEYTVKLPGQVVSGGSKKLDLSGLSEFKLRNVLTKAPLLPELESIELMGEDGACELSKSDVRRIMDAWPEAEVHYAFDLFGQTVDTLDERVEINCPKLADSDEDEIRAALDILPHCSYFKLDEDRFGISDEIMDSIREDYRDRTKVVWRVFIRGIDMLTDEDILRVTFSLNDYNSAPLQYCEDALYLDVGHNGQMSDISFVARMPRLECLILSGSVVRDISALANCPNLTWLELCYCSYVEDLSCLKGHENLKYLNISYTSVNDVSMLKDVALERMVGFKCWNLPKEQQEAFDEAHPDCLSAWDGEQPYGYPWRYNSTPNVATNFFDYYVHMRTLFVYDDKGYNNYKLSPYGPGYLEQRDPELALERQGKAG